MSYKDEFTPHKPAMYVCGIYIYQTNVWCGEFEATTEELINYGNEALDGPEFLLVENMVNTTLIYEDWWSRQRQNLNF